jgi:hypothetical protein
MARGSSRHPAGPRSTCALVGALACLVLATACGGGGGGGGGGGSTTVTNPIVASFTASGTASSPDLVRMTGTVTGNQVTLNIVLAGVTTNSDLYSFAFDLVLGDGTVAEYVSSSVTFGNALTLSGGQTSSALASQNGNTIVVGVSKLGGGSGNGIGASEDVVVTLNLRLRKRQATTITFGGPPTALDSLGNNIGTIQFDGAAAMLQGT